MEQNGNGALVDSVPALVTNPVGTQNENEHLRIDAKRLFQKLRGLKGHLTREVKNCITIIGQFRTLMENDADKSIMIEYAREITETFSRCQTRQADIETGIEDYVQMKSEIWDVNDDNGLTELITKQDAESEL